MPRKMINDSGTVVTVHEVLALRNFWEIYILDNNVNDDIRYALTIGNETEFGDISMSEVKPFIVTGTKKMDCYPAPGWRWAE